MIAVLDCTLRDGGYINDWSFSKLAINKIIDKLVESNIDIVECGYLSQSKGKKGDSSLYPTIDDITPILNNIRNNDTKFACMINFGEYRIQDIPDQGHSKLHLIRLAFHKKDLHDAISYASLLICKGYEVYLQPMVTMAYSDADIMELVEASNKIHPQAVYIVDSFGTLTNADIKHYTTLLHNNLEHDIALGFHSHNNLQLALSNSVYFIDLVKNWRSLIVDSSVFGIGRGAGNLCTELITRHLMGKKMGNYNVQPLLEIMDEYLLPLYVRHPWGYSAAYYLSAICKCHPNYATYLLSKQTLQVRSIENILSLIPASERLQYNLKLIDDLYLNYQTTSIDDSKTLESLKSKLEMQNILVIASGRSISIECEKINSYINREKPIIISVNFIPKNIEVDYLFISNRKRFDMLNHFPSNQTIITSNIIDRSPDCLSVNYNKLLNQSPVISDNSGLMLLSLLKKIGVKNIVLAGFDGYSENSTENYCEDHLIFAIQDKNYTLLKNEEISSILSEFGKTLNIQYITKSAYCKLDMRQK